MENRRQKRFLLISIIPQKVTQEEILQELQELKSLVETYGGIFAELVTQKRELKHGGMYIGPGKIEETAELIKDKAINVVVMNEVLKATELFEFKTIWQKVNPKIEVWDRVDLILHIFSLHANTAEAKLQIELAFMRHMGPRIYGMGYVLSRQGGGIGTLGVGETNTELMRRHWRDQIKEVQDKLTKLSNERQRQLNRRQKIGLHTISIIGYTNAGKTSLFNLLSGKQKLAKNVLFATLESSVGKMYLPELHKEVLLSDTIGFIQNLPARLIDAFKSTLMESIHADLLLQVIDAADPHMEKKIAVVGEILQDLGISDKPRLFIFNKIDAATNFDQELLKKYSTFSPLCISVKEDAGIQALKSAIESQFAREIQSNGDI